MSGKLSFREQLERQVDFEVGSPAPSGSPVSVVLRLSGAVDRPVTLIQTLTRWGLGLRNAHAAVSGLVEGRKLAVLLPTPPEPAELVSTLEGLGIEAGFPHAPAVEVAPMRRKLP